MKKSTDALFDSVRQWFDLTGEVDLRIREHEKGLDAPERNLLRPLPPQSRILDIGCAAGRASFALAREGHAVVGIDVAERLIAAAQAAAKKQDIDATFQVCDPLQLPFPDHAFDAVLLLKTYCYVPKRQNRIAWLGDIARVVKPGGWLFLSQYIIDDVLGSYDPIREENRERFPDLCEKLEQGDGFTLPDKETQAVGYVHYFLEADLLDELNASPFQIVESFRDDTICYCAVQLP